jgi:hypothetical protein
MKIVFALLVIFGAPAANASPVNYLSELAELVLANRDYRPEELNDPALYPATTEFGPTLIPMAQLPIETELVSAKKKPWSSHWFPRAEKDIFEDGRGGSPIEKYDLVRATLTNSASDAAAFERSRHKPDAPKWEGLCDAWAIASLLFPEPTRSRTLRLDGGYHNFNNNRVTFSVGDQKALLLKSVEAISSAGLKVYGQKFLGDFAGWIYPDLFPQELHRFVEKQLFEKREAFVMDHDPGVEVWNEPVFKGNYKITALPGRSDAVNVRLWLYSAAPLRREEKDRVGTKEVTREYNYILYGKLDGQGNLVVDSGAWQKGDLVDSRRDHPDYVFTIPNLAAIVPASYNNQFDPAIVKQILGR